MSAASRFFCSTYSPRLLEVHVMQWDYARGEKVSKTTLHYGVGSYSTHLYLVCPNMLHVHT